METKEQYLLEAKNLSKYFPVKNFFGKLVQANHSITACFLNRFFRIDGIEFCISFCYFL